MNESKKLQADWVDQVDRLGRWLNKALEWIFSDILRFGAVLILGAGTIIGILFIYFPDPVIQERAACTPGKLAVNGSPGQIAHGVKLEMICDGRTVFVTDPKTIVSLSGKDVVARCQLRQKSEQTSCVKN